MSRKKAVYPLLKCFGIRDPKSMASKKPGSSSSSKAESKDMDEQQLSSEKQSILCQTSTERQDLLRSNNSEEQDKQCHTTTQGEGLPRPSTAEKQNPHRKNGTTEVKFIIEGEISDNDDEFDCEGAKGPSESVKFLGDVPGIQANNIEDTTGPPLPVKKRDKSQSCCPLPAVMPRVSSAVEDNVDDPMKYQPRRHRGGRDMRSPRNSSGIDVKYTKIFGESDGAYRNDSVPRGLVFMCNFTNYKGNAHPERQGSQKDFNNLLSLFHQLGYETYRYVEKYCKSGYITKENFLQMLRDFSQEQRHELSCSSVIIIMSHGSGPKTFITSDNKEVDLMEVYEMLDNINCTKLKGKPKIFILQFCRSSPKTVPNQVNLTQQILRSLIREEIQNAFGKMGNEDALHGIDVRSPRFLSLVERSNNSPSGSFSFSFDLNGMQDITDSSLNTTTDGAEGEALGENTTSPYQADTKHIVSQPLCGVQRFSDMYSIFSTASGELSQRDPSKGSLLIQAICHVFAEYAYQDEIDIMVRKVSQYMIKILQKDDPIHVPRQTCERTNNGLDKYFYFNPVKLPFNRYVTI